MSLHLSETLEKDCPSSSRVHPFVPQDLTGRITTVANQYCAAGSFGDVYRGQYHGECGVQEVAVKTFRFGFSVEDDDIYGRSTRMIRRELGIWKRLSHPNIVPFLGTVSGFGRLGNAALVSSWMPHGTLQDFLQKYDDGLTVAHRLQLLLGIADGLQYLHSLSIVHGDLTSNNVLLDEKYNARLIDFGYASPIGEIPEALAYLQASTLRPGTVRWAAPEYFTSNPEEMFHCTTKSDIYSFGNIALQMLSGKLPWSEFRRDAVVVLHLAKGHKPRRPQSRPIDDQHWEVIEHCWSPVQQRPSAEYLVGLLVSSEKNNPPSTLSGSLLSPPNIEQLSPVVPLEVPRTFENEHLGPPNWQHDLSQIFGALSPPRTSSYPPQLIPDSNPSTPPFLPLQPLIQSIPNDDDGNKAASQSTPDTLRHTTGTAFPKRPPPVHSKSSAISPPFLDSSSIGQDQLSIYPLLYPYSHQHSIDRQYSQGTATFGRGDRGAASRSCDERNDGIWRFFSRLSPYARTTPKRSSSDGPFQSSFNLSNANLPQFSFSPTSPNNISPYLMPNTSLMTRDQLNALEGSALDDSAPTVSLSLNEVLPQQQPRRRRAQQQQAPPPPPPQQQHSSSAGPTQSSSNLSNANLPQFNFNPTSANNMSAYITPDPTAVGLRRVKSDSVHPGHNRLSRSEDMTSSMVYPPSSQQAFINRQFLYPQETVPFIRGHSCRASSGSRGGGDGSWSALSSNRPSPYPSPSASPRVRYEDLPNVALTRRQPSMLRPNPTQPNPTGVVTVSKQTVMSERTADASHRRRKQDAEFLCPVPGCGSTFTRSFNLKAHMRSHNEERPFHCKWPHCGKAFFRQRDCERHEQLHSKYRPFSCEGCKKPFARMDHLNRHLRSEGGAECRRIIDAAKDSERLFDPKTEEKGWPGMSVTV